MIFRPPVKEIPSNDHIRAAEYNLREHVLALTDTQDNLRNYFQKSLSGNPKKHI